MLMIKLLSCLPNNEESMKGAGKACLLDDDINNALSYIKQLSDTREMASKWKNKDVSLAFV